MSSKAMHQQKKSFHPSYSCEIEVAEGLEEVAEDELMEQAASRHVAHLVFHCRDLLT